jgi:hypothetical protein
MSTYVRPSKRGTNAGVESARYALVGRLFSRISILNHRPMMAGATHTSLTASAVREVPRVFTRRGIREKRQRRRAC